MSDIPNPPNLPPTPPMGEPEPPRRFETPDYQSYPEPNYEYAQRKINAPAIALMVAALISALWCIYSLFSVMFTSPEQNIEAMRDLFQQLDMQYDVDEEMLRQFGGGNKVVSFLFWGAFLLIDFFLFYAAMKMRSLKNYGMGMAASIIAIIPCCWSACCILNVPFGIWLLVVLRDPEVKAAFEGT